MDLKAYTIERQFMNLVWKKVMHIELAFIWLVTSSTLNLSAGTEIDFNAQIRPILSENCFHCHGPDKEARKADLRLDNFASAHELRKGAVAIKSGAPDESEIWKRITSNDPDSIMPPPESKKSLNEEQIALIRKWIEQGGHYSEHWAFIHPSKTDFSALYKESGLENPIDKFVSDKHLSIGASFSKEASPSQLVRRLHLDLVGLPPDQQDIQEFIDGIESGSPEFYNSYVDALLRRTSYGEHWARPWLDLARYADSNGFQADQIRDSWAYRDWVIQAFNANMPYDEFTIEQLAGDLMPSSSLSQKIATGFHRTVTCNVEAGVHAEQNRVNQVVDRVNTTSTVWLGLTLECAQCHDHKYDPFTMDDYYSFYAFFNNTPLEVELPTGVTDVQHNFIGPYLELPLSTEDKKLKSQLLAEIEGLNLKLNQLVAHKKTGLNNWLTHLSLNESGKFPKAIQTILKKDITKRSGKDKDQLRKHFISSNAATKDLQTQIDSLQTRYNQIQPVKTLVMEELESPRETKVMRRGNYLDPMHSVEPDSPQFLPSMDSSLPKNRLGLSKWLVNSQNPLTARVAVNRVWAELWGQGIVKTVEDFGVQSDYPSHPALLDWLALYFMESGWDQKALIKLIVTSKAYKQSSNVSPLLMRMDPENKELTRGARFRMDAERIRDTLLASSGLLSTKKYGPPVMPYQPSGIWRAVGRNAPVWKEMKSEDRWRRGVYIVYRRAAPYPSMVNFDAPDRSSCAVTRARTNTPLQALTLLNDPAYIEMALGLADRVVSQNKENLFDKDLDSLFMWSLSRLPHPLERQYLSEAFRTHLNDFIKNPDKAKKVVFQNTHFYKPQSNDVTQLAAWFMITTTIFNLDEIVTKG